jgi:membrane-associated phospholipid phosphatase
MLKKWISNSNQHVTAVFLFLSILSSPANASFTEKSGSVLEIAMPLTAFGLSYYQDDMEGMKQFAYALTATAATSFLLKETVKKDRPDGSGDDAFPSGHAAVTFSSASFLERRYGWKVGAPAYLLASWTAYSRVAIDKHSVEDVLAGAAIGYAFSYFIVSEFNKEQQTTLLFAPLVSSKYIGVSAHLSF